jgi:hypothetical protein
VKVDRINWHLCAISLYQNRVSVLARTVALRPETVVVAQQVNLAAKRFGHRRQIKDVVVAILHKLFDLTSGSFKDTNTIVLDRL